jgi:hypothetical protein
MTYYRLALQHPDTSIWAWKSTVLTSLDAVFHLLRVFRTLAPERVRVFSACCKEELNRMLDLENNGVATGSVTVTAFLRVGNPQTGKTAQDLAEQAAIARQPRAAELSLPLPAPALPAERKLSGLEEKRLEFEMGVGGDHDLPYLFTLPPSVPQLLAWLRLLMRVQRGELHP